MTKQLSKLKWMILDVDKLPKELLSLIDTGELNGKADVIFMDQAAGKHNGWMIYIRDGGVWKQAKLLRERFYKASGALERMKYPPKDWQMNLFGALERGDEGAVKCFEFEQALDFSADELRIIAAIQKMYEKRDWKPTSGAGVIQRIDGGSWGITGEFPNLFFSIPEGLTEWGAERYTTKDGKREFRGWDREKFMNTLEALSKRDIPYRIASKRMVKKKDVNGKTVWEPEVKILKPTPRPLFYIVEETDWMNNEELAQYQSGSKGKVKYILLEPSPIFFIGILHQSGRLADKRGDFILKPWDLYNKLSKVNPRATLENIKFVEIILKEIAERRQHAPKDAEISYTITRTDRELARLMNWRGSIKARNWAQIRSSIKHRIRDAKKAGYLLGCHTEPTARGRKYHLEANPETCQYSPESGEVRYAAHDCKARVT